MKAPVAAQGPNTLPYYELPTDVQDLTATDPDFLRVSDEDIDKAIADIKAALRKHEPQRQWAGHRTMRGPAAGGRTSCARCASRGRIRAPPRARCWWSSATPACCA